MEKQNLQIRTIGPGQAEPALVGQEGVFAKNDIPAGVPVSLFGGMILTAPKDVKFDKHVRMLAGLHPRKYVDGPNAVGGSGVLQGMGISMKLNSGGTDEESNLVPVHLNVMSPEGRKIQIQAFISSKPIPAGTELRFAYDFKRNQEAEE